ELAGVARLVRPRQDFPEQPQRSLPFEEVDAGDEPGVVRPRVDIDAPAAAQFLHQAAVHEAEVEAELVPHLLLPLDLQGRGADDEDAPGPMPDDEFQRRHAGLNALAQEVIVALTCSYRLRLSALGRCSLKGPTRTNTRLPRCRRSSITCWKACHCNEVSRST